MRVVLAALLTVAVSTAAGAQGAAPDLKGTWTGKFRSIVYGANSHHPGAQAVTDVPRVRELEFSFEIIGQDGGLLWGNSWSDPAVKEPFAWTIVPDGKSIVGADTDGTFQISIVSPTELNLCYEHTGLSPSKSIVASCGSMSRH
jgi:hypothetical protein